MDFSVNFDKFIDNRIENHLKSNKASFYANITENRKIPEEKPLRIIRIDENGEGHHEVDSLA